jgi:NAD+ synthase
MTLTTSFSPAVLELDAGRAVQEITAGIRQLVFQQFRKKGVVVGLSGGIDSSVTAALCARALGPERVLGLFLPENESSGESLELGRLLAESLGIDTVLENITPLLEAVGCYRRRDAAIRRVIPEYTDRWKAKIVLPSVTTSDTYRLFSVVARSPAGKEMRARLTPSAYLEIVAATNFKQRSRKMLEYYHADARNYAVAGTPNRLEYDQGFFVKLGDGAADLKPIAHLYKSQVYQLAAYLNLPKVIRTRPPTTDTYSLPQSQEEFYFSLPYQQMDLCLYAHNHHVPASEVAPALGLQAEQVARVYRDIESKRRVARYLRAEPQLLGEIEDSVPSDEQ